MVTVGYLGVIIKGLANCCLRFRGVKGRKTSLLDWKMKINKKLEKSYVDVKKQEAKNK